LPELKIADTQTAEVQAVDSQMQTEREPTHPLS
jgi:hypothetical protein